MKSYNQSRLSELHVHLSVHMRKIGINQCQDTVLLLFPPSLSELQVCERVHMHKIGVNQCQDTVLLLYPISSGLRTRIQLGGSRPRIAGFVPLEQDVGLSGLGRSSGTARTWSFIRHSNTASIPTCYIVS
jgi:hypothetical protein